MVTLVFISSMEKTMVVKKKYSTKDKSRLKHLMTISMITAKDGIILKKYIVFENIKISSKF